MGVGTRSQAPPCGTYLTDILRLETAAGLPVGDGGQLEPGGRKTTPHHGKRLLRVRGVLVGPPII